MAKSSEKTAGPPSAFRALGLAKTVEAVCGEIHELYLADEIPWVVGYSGGKDSSAALQLVWLAIRKLPVAERKKPIHVISTDTLVEQPVVARWVAESPPGFSFAVKVSRYVTHIKRLLETPEHLPLLYERIRPLLD